MRTALLPVIEPTDPPHNLMRAAGGVLWRRSPTHRFEIAVLHRPHREDWSFPKGKLDPGETFEECALREVFEESGFTCELAPFIGTTEYIHRKGRPKIVAYWLMDIVGGEFRPNPEADEIRWCSLAEARRLVTYDRDRDLVDLVAALPRAVA